MGQFKSIRQQNAEKGENALTAYEMPVVQPTEKFPVLDAAEAFCSWINLMIKSGKAICTIALAATETANPGEFTVLGIRKWNEERLVVLYRDFVGSERMDYVYHWHALKVYMKR